MITGLDPEKPEIPKNNGPISFVRLVNEYFWWASEAGGEVGVN
jgi:hypothetical protein